MNKLIHNDDNVSLPCYIGTLLRKARIKNGLAGRELAERVNVSQQQISRYERGKTDVHINKLFQLLLALDMDADEVMNFFYQIVVEAGFTPEFISANAYEIWNSN